MAKLSRDKGADFERRCARWLKTICGPGLFTREIRETQQGNLSDIVSSPLQMRVQCKKGKAPSPWKAVQEVEESLSSSELGVAFIHRDARGPGLRSEQLVCMRPSTFRRLLVRWAGHD